MMGDNGSTGVKFFLGKLFVKVFVKFDFCKCFSFQMFNIAIK